MAAPTDRARFAPLVVSALALIVSIYAALRPNAPPGSASWASERAELVRAQDDLRREIAPLRAEVAELRLRAPAAVSTGSAGAAVAPVATTGAPASSSAPDYVGYEVTNPALTVMPNGKGGLIVMNSDPALTGKTVTVSAKRANGEVVKLDVLVPPPR